MFSRNVYEYNNYMSFVYDIMQTMRKITRAGGERAIIYSVASVARQLTERGNPKLPRSAREEELAKKVRKNANAQWNRVERKRAFEYVASCAERRRPGVSWPRDSRGGTRL